MEPHGCEHGAAKSVMAAAQFERLAKAEELSFQIVPQVAPGVRQGLKAGGLPD